MNVFYYNTSEIAWLLNVILSGKTSSIRMRIKDIRKPPVGQTEVIMWVELALS